MKTALLAGAAMVLVAPAVRCVDLHNAVEAAESAVEWHDHGTHVHSHDHVDGGEGLHGHGGVAHVPLSTDDEDACCQAVRSPLLAAASRGDDAVPIAQISPLLATVTPAQSALVVASLVRDHRGAACKTPVFLSQRRLLL